MIKFNRFVSYTIEDSISEMNHWLKTHSITKDRIISVHEAIELRSHPYPGVKLSIVTLWYFAA